MGLYVATMVTKVPFCLSAKSIYETNCDKIWINHADQNGSWIMLE